MQGSTLTTGILVVAMVAVFYFLIIRPQRRRQQEQQKIQSSMQPGTRVMLSSGIYATVVSVGDKQAVVELSPGNEVTVLKQVIMQVVTPDSPYAEDKPTSGTSTGGAIAASTEPDPDPTPEPEDLSVERPEGSATGPTGGTTSHADDGFRRDREPGGPTDPDDRPDTDPKA